MVARAEQCGLELPALPPRLAGLGHSKNRRRRACVSLRRHALPDPAPPSSTRTLRGAKGSRQSAQPNAAYSSSNYWWWCCSIATQRRLRVQRLTRTHDTNAVPQQRACSSRSCGSTAVLPETETPSSAAVVAERRTRSRIESTRPDVRGCVRDGDAAKPVREGARSYLTA
eukprot:354880-Chlamydomonas_euryale.AAC.8